MVNNLRFTISHRRTEESSETEYFNGEETEYFNGEGHTLTGMTVIVIDQIYIATALVSTKYGK